MDNYHQICMSCMNKYVGLQTQDGKTYDGFIAHVDDNFVTLAIPTNEMMHGGTQRPFGYGPGFYPRRRFYPMRVPLPLITSLFLLPFFL